MFVHTGGGAIVSIEGDPRGSHRAPGATDWEKCTRTRRRGVDGCEPVDREGQGVVRQAAAQAVQELLGERMAHDAATAIADKLTTGTWTHHYRIGSEEAKQLGLPISTDMPQDVYNFMALFPQPTRLRPAVEYIPLPYRGARQGR